MELVYISTIIKVPAPTVWRMIHKQLEKKALSNAVSMAKTLNMSVPTSRAALNNLVELGIVKEISGTGKERLYIYQELINLLEQGAEPISI